MTIIQIETATTVCSVALSQNGQVVAVKELNERNIHAEVVTLYIDDLLKQTNLTYTDVDAVAVSSGPGSYTGLRIGVSTAKGLCFALDKPLIAVQTLAAMAQGMIESSSIAPGALLCPMIDARRMEVYTALFTADGSEVKSTSAEIIDENSFADYLKNNSIVFFGDGAEKCREMLGGNPNAVFVTNFLNSATHISKQAADKFAKGQFEDVAYFEPFYLKDFLVTQKKA